MKVNYCHVKDVTLSAVKRESLSERELLVLNEMKTFIGPIKVETSIVQVMDMNFFAP